MSILNEKWAAIAPAMNIWRAPENVELPYRISERIWLQTIPEWVAAPPAAGTVDLLLPKLREFIEEEGATYCLYAEYEAEALGSPDPQWRGPEPRAIQDSLASEISDFFFALWLVRPTTVTFERIAHVSRPTSSDRLVRQIASYDPSVPLACYEDYPYTLEELASARELFRALSSLPLTGTLRTAAGALARSRTEGQWLLRFLLLWLVMESLYGANDARETTYRLCQRVGLFLGGNGSDARALFRSMKDSYSWRSKIVHGLRLASLKAEQSTELLEELEGIVHRSFNRVLGDERLTKIFDGKDREEFLESLVFGWPTEGSPNK